MQAKNRIICALDVPIADEALRYIEMLSPHVGMFKVGLELIYSLLFSGEGPRFFRHAEDLGAGLFLDTKLEDISNTVIGAASQINSHVVEMFNVHCKGGLVMMRGAAVVAHTAHPPMQVLGVTILTSLGTDDLLQLGFKTGNAEELVRGLALLAKEAELDGVVASPREASVIREACGSDFLIVTPGIRPTWAATGDQKRITTPAEAIRGGADFLVIGRPILQPPATVGGPIEAAQLIAMEIQAALEGGL